MEVGGEIVRSRNGSRSELGKKARVSRKQA